MTGGVAPARPPRAAARVPERLSLRALREAVQGCRGWELSQDPTQAVTGDGRVAPDPAAALHAS